MNDSTDPDKQNSDDAPETDQAQDGTATGHKPGTLSAHKQPSASPTAAWDPLLELPGGRAHRDDVMGNHWSVPWSDLMMVMFVLFAALVTAQLMQSSEPEPVLQDRIVEIEKDRPRPEPVLSPEPSFEPLMRINVFEQSQQAVREANLQNVEIVLLDDQSVKVSVQGPLFFDSGETVLKSEVRTFLGRLATIIRQTDYRVNVIGHTDDQPINTELFPSNWELSLMRATAVTKFLIGQGRVAPARFTIMGRGEYDPATPNANDEYRALNRRVEIIITRDKVSSPEDRL